MLVSDKWMDLSGEDLQRYGPKELIIWKFVNSAEIDKELQQQPVIQKVEERGRDLER